MLARIVGDPLSLPWRTGRKVGRTIYAQHGPEPSDDDVLIGVMDTPELAAEAVRCHNRSGRVVNQLPRAMERADQ